MPFLGVVSLGALTTIGYKLAPQYMPVFKWYMVDIKEQQDLYHPEEGFPFRREG